ncbi:MAG: N-acetylmuramoyl-L-alanine amidase [Nitrospirae bacterium]|nr:N-acetylmuramoyl-L-alanine amidase [Nitrospirota bacterium]
MKKLCVCLIIILLVPFAGFASAAGSDGELLRYAASAGKVVIDPGHGGFDPGLPGEKESVLVLAGKLRDMFREAGTKVALTRDANRYVSLQERASRVNNETPDLYVGLHRSRARFSVFSAIENSVRAESEGLRDRMLAGLAEAFGEDAVSSRQIPLYMTEHIHTPGVLVEIPANIDLDDETVSTPVIRAILQALEPSSENRR